MKDQLTILHGDCRETLKTLNAGSVQCVVTSPPYFGLRDYGAPGQIGLEKTPAEYVAALVAVFAEVWRVLRDDGTVWLNLGDSYAGSGRGPTGHNGIGNHETRQGFHSPKVRDLEGLKPKDLIGIPWRVAFALQDAGWYLRSDIIWAKPNCMPESVTDRPTRSHEYLFLLTKKPNYYYDADAIREDFSPTSHPNSSGGFVQTSPGQKRTGDPTAEKMNGLNFTYRGNVSTQPNPAGRNRRTVWTVSTKPYSGSHFAVFPEALIEPCILAGTSPMACEAKIKKLRVRDDLTPTEREKVEAFLSKKGLL